MNTFHHIAFEYLIHPVLESYSFDAFFLQRITMVDTTRMATSTTHTTTDTRTRILIIAVSVVLSFQSVFHTCCSFGCDVGLIVWQTIRTRTPMARPLFRSTRQY